MPGAALQWIVEAGEHFRMLVQPGVQAFGAVKNAKQADQCNRRKSHYLDQGFGSNADYPAFVIFPRSGVACGAPHRIARRVMSRQKQAAWLSGSLPSPRISIGSASTWTCSDSSASMQTIIMNVVSAPAPALRKRNANRSASALSW